MNVLVTGAGGLIGGALSEHLRRHGHCVVRVTRAASAGSPEGPEVRWDPASHWIDRAALSAGGPYAAAVHLAGAGIADRRWSTARRREIMASRVRSTSLLAATLPELDPLPGVFVSASAVGYYGDRGDEELTEDSAPGSGFLATVCAAWERAAAPVEEAGLRLVLLRTAIVLDAAGGALARQLPLFRVGLGGRLGDGHQFVSWITLQDEVAAIVAAIENPVLRGPLNLSAPGPVTNRAFTRAVAEAVHRPAVLSVPRPALAIALGRDLTTEALLASQRVLPTRLLAADFEFSHPDIDDAMAAVLGSAP